MFYKLIYKLEYLYIADTIDKNNEFEIGISWLLNNSKTTGGFLAVNTIDEIYLYSKYPGMSALVTLDNYRHQSILNYVKLDLVTILKIPSNGFDKPLLAINPTEIYLDKLSTIPNISKILVLPWNKNEILEWIYSNSAMPI